MLYRSVDELYKKFRLVHYRNMFGRISERDGSLSATEAFASDVIYLLGDPTVKQFADCVGISQPNATYKANNLAAKGYITKTVSEDDKRECRLYVTDKFLEYYGHRDEYIEKASERLTSEYGEKELQLFKEMLERLCSALEETDGEN